TRRRWRGAVMLRALSTPGAVTVEARAEAAALARAARDVERRAVARERVLGDREAEPGAAGLARAAAVHAVEALAQPRQVLGRDADARVLDVERGAVGRGMPAKAHPAALGRIADRVAHQVAQRARDLLLAAQELHARFALHLDAVAAARQRARVRGHARDEPPHVDGFLHRWRRRRFER